jgi:membrane protein
MFLTAGLLAVGFAPAGQSSVQGRGAAVQKNAREDRPGTPFEIPARDWKRLLLRVYGDVSRHRLLVISAGVTFYALLAIFPAVAALVALYGIFADPSTITGHLDTVSGLFPGGAIDVLRDQMNRVAAQGRGTLGLAFFIGLVASLWSANSATKSMFDALNLVYGVQEKRSFIRLTLISLGFTAAVILFGLVALSAMIVVPVVLDAFGLKDATALLVKVLRWPFLILIVSVLLAALYRYGPSRQGAEWRWISWGSTIAALGWLVLSLMFSWYAGNYGSFNKTYGSLGAVIGFMIWMWLSTAVILIGAEIDAKIEEYAGARAPAPGALKLPIDPDA